MPEKKVIIIGAGLAGLATGIYARMNGYQAHIFEHANQPGGVSSTWKRKGYTIDGGIHFYMGYRPGKPVHDLYRELGIYQPDQYQEITTYGRYLDPEHDLMFDLTSDLDRFAADLKAISPADAGFIDDFINGAKAFKTVSFTTGLNKPPELMRFWDTAKMMLSLGKKLKYYGGRYNRSMAQASKDLNDPWVREILEGIFLPEVPAWFTLFILGVLAGGHMALRLDGSAGFARALEKRFTDLGGQLTYKATVEEILVEKEKAVGIRLKNGDEHRADRIVSAADGYSTIFEFLKGRFVDDSIRERYEKWPLFKPVVMISYGVNRKFPDDPWMVLIKSSPKISAGHLTGAWLTVRIFNYSPAFAPPGKTVVQVMIESEWEPWQALREDMDAYKAEKDQLARQVLETLSTIWPGIVKQVEMTDVATPYTYYRYTFNRKGAYEGFAITPAAIRAKIYRTLPDLSNFYMAGQWVSPGGGVIPSLMTGKHAVMLLCRQDSKKFGTTLN
jgi:phytoene dehydrogenase-like protein